jgi:hypothetical protein
MYRCGPISPTAFVLEHSAFRHAPLKTSTHKSVTIAAVEDVLFIVFSHQNRQNVVNDIQGLCTIRIAALCHGMLEKPASATDTEEETD